jgi:hypothetical protein
MNVGAQFSYGCQKLAGAHLADNLGEFTKGDE